MKHLHFIPQLNSEPIRLTDAEQEHPETVIEEFFQCYHLGEVRLQLQTWLFRGLMADDYSLHQPTERSRLFFFCHQLEALAEATYILYAKGMLHKASKG